MTFVNRLHNLLCPADSICYGSYGSRNPRSAIVLRQLSCREDRRGDQQHALATFVHKDQRSIFSFYSLHYP